MAPASRVFRENDGRNLVIGRGSDRHSRCALAVVRLAQESDLQHVRLKMALVASLAVACSCSQTAMNPGDPSSGDYYQLELLRCLFTSCLVCRPKLSGNVQVSTPAGSGTNGYSDAQGNAAQFSGPAGLAFDDATGDLYIADSGNNVIRRMTASGFVHTVAGNGTPMFADGTSATASFNAPIGIAFFNNTVYVGDTGNNRIRKIDLLGNVTTLAGSGPGFTNAVGGAAQFTAPSGVAVDSLGFVYVADASNHAIRRVAPDGTVTTPAGTNTPGFADGNGSSARFTNPTGVAVAPNGNIIVADTGNHAIRKVDSAGNTVTIAGTNATAFVDGAATSARFNFPSDVFVDPDSNIFVADLSNHAVRRLNAEHTTVATLAGNGTPATVNGAASTAQFNGPQGIGGACAGRLYVAQSGGSVIRSIVR